MSPSKLVAKRPQPGTLRTWDFPGFTRTRLDNGFQLIVAQTPGRTLAAAQLLLEAGASNEPDSEGGVAGIAVNALIEGTGKHKGASFVQALEELGADINGGANWDSFRLNMQVPPSRMESALELLAEAVRDPQFGSKEVDRLIQERTGGILQEYANASSRARLAFDKLIYTPDSPYARSAGGNFWSVSTMGKKAIKKYYERFATPESATLILVGDLNGFPAEKVAEKLFGGWKSKEPQRTPPTVRENLPHTSILLVDRPESAQSHFELGHVAVPRLTPDYFPILVMGTALGGLFDSRLNRVLREEKGFTYGASGGFEFRRQAGPFRAVTSVDTEKTVDAIRETVKVVQDIHSDGITKQELEQVKGFLTGVFTLRFETPSAIAFALAEMVVYGLADDYWESYRSNVASVTLDQANQAAADYLHPDRLGIVVVGDYELVGDPLFDANLGTVAHIEDSEPGRPPIH
jgi:zinc protease